MPVRSARNLQRVLAQNSDSSRWTKKAPSAVEPSGAGVLDVPQHGDSRDSELELLPFGTDAAGAEFAVRIWRWTTTMGGVWWPTPIVELAVVLGDIPTGDADTYQADTLTESYGDSENARIVSPEMDCGAWAIVDLCGAQKVEFDWRVDDATGANAMYRFMS